LRFRLYCVEFSLENRSVVIALLYKYVMSLNFSRSILLVRWRPNRCAVSGPYLRASATDDTYPGAKRKQILLRFTARSLNLHNSRTILSKYEYKMLFEYRLLSRASPLQWRVLYPPFVCRWWRVLPVGCNVYYIPFSIRCQVKSIRAKLQVLNTREFTLILMWTRWWEVNGARYYEHISIWDIGDKETERKEEVWKAASKASRPFIPEYVEQSVKIIILANDTYLIRCCTYRIRTWMASSYTIVWSSTGQCRRV
jgi:hypothetical protein